MNYEMLENMNENQLFIEIAKNVHTSVSLLDIDTKDYIKLGKDWVKQNLDIVKNNLCSEKVNKLLKNESNTKQLVLVISDILSTYFTDIPVLTFAVLISKIGIEKICLDEYII